MSSIILPIQVINSKSTLISRPHTKLLSTKKTQNVRLYNTIAWCGGWLLRGQTGQTGLSLTGTVPNGPGETGLLGETLQGPVPIFGSVSTNYS